MVAVLHGVHELVRGNKGELLGHHEHNDAGDDPADDHPDDVLGDPAEHNGGIEGCLEMGHLSRES
jgi:hypothetical protein